MNRQPFKQASTFRGIVFVCAGMLCLVLMDTLNKTLARDLPPVEVSWARNFALVLVLLAVVGPRLGRRLVRTQKPKLQVVRGLLFAAASTMGVFGLQALPLADALTILNLQPLMVIGLAALVLREKVGWHRWAAVAVGFAGVVVIMQPGGGGSIIGGLWVLGACLCGAGYIVGNRLLGPGEHPVAALFLCSVVSGLVLTTLLPFFWVPPTTPFHWAGFLGTGILSGLGHYCLIRAYSSAPASAVAPFNYSHLVWALLMSFLVFGDPVTLTTVLGIAIIAGAGLYVIHRERQDRSGEAVL
jgi:drug/metabolite transporter (DMT)-like permease